MDTIVAVSTAAGAARRSIVRLSGPDAVAIADAVFRTDTCNLQLTTCKLTDESRHHLASLPTWSVVRGSLSILDFGFWILDYAPSVESSAGESLIQNPKSKIQNPLSVPCLAYVMRAPRSYTREDVVEFHLIGNPALTSAVVHTILDFRFRILDYGSSGGASASESVIQNPKSKIQNRVVRLAHPGEFTERAYLAGRIDLAQAEAVLKLIHARSDAERKLAVSEMTGGLSKRIDALSSALFETLTRVELILDFSEDVTDEDLQLSTLKVQLESWKLEVESLLRDGSGNYVFTETPRVSIVGRANVGKSSLFNRLLGRDRAIVTDVSGTTRDLLEEELDLGGLKCLLVDTAGNLQLTTCNLQVESCQLQVASVTDEAVRRAREEFSRADLLLLVLDASEPFNAVDRDLLDRTSTLPALVVFNKCDKPPGPAVLDLQAASCQLQVSCLTGEGIDRLRDEIREALSLKGVDRSAQRFLLNLRQLDALRSARASLDNALAALRDCVGLEFPAAEIRTAINHLRELTHPMAEEEILDAIFSGFCIGK